MTNFKLKHMNYLKTLSTIFALSVLCLGTKAQPKQSNNDEQIPIDENVKIGKLDNGFTYYIRKNNMPKERAEFFLTVDAGAILENDNQDGLAHFCEHMCFNGTKNFEEHQIIKYLQSIGMKFGPEINAFTSHDVTNYMLQKVPTTDPLVVDTALLILYDWANNVSFENEEIDKERGVIHEEWRTRRGAQFRLSTKTDKVLLKESKYAKRDVIGDIDIIDNFEYQVIRDFYHDWYRPDLQALIAVGDFDVDKMEKKIKDLFGKTPKRENPKERKLYEIPDHKETLIAIETDEEARFPMIQVYYKHDVVKNEKKEFISYAYEELKHRIYNTIFRERIEEIKRQPNPPFSYAYTYYGNIRRTKDAYTSVAISNNQNIEKSIDVIFTENKRIKKYGFTAGELERAKKKILKDVENEYNERNKKESLKYVWNYFSHFLSNEPIPGIEFQYEYTQKTLPEITVEEINALADKWITDENRVVIVTAPKKEEIKVPTKERVLEIIKEVEAKEVKPIEDKTITEPLLAKTPEPVEIIEEDKDDELGIVEWKLKNGATVVIKSTEFKDDEIRFNAFSKGGYSLYAADDYMTLTNAAGIVDQSGVSNFSISDLEKIMSDKEVSLRPWIGELEEGFRGRSSKKDFESMLKLLYLYFTEPREDKNAFDSYIARQKGMLQNKALDPRSVLGDSLTITIYQNHPYRQPLTAERMDQIDFEKVSTVFKERFSDASDFTFVFVGNIDPKKDKELIQSYIGGLPSENKNENWKDLNIRPPKDAVEKEIYRELKVPKSTVFIAFNGEYDYSVEERYALSALSEILDVRYTESIREEQGGTYGVGVNTRQEKYPYMHYMTIIYFDCAPENAKKLSQIVFDEIKQIQENGPKEQDLKNFKENKLKEHKEKLEKNNYWLRALKNKYYYNLDNSSITNYEEYVKNVDAEDVQEAAKNFMKLDKYVKIIMYPEEDK